MTDGKGKSTTTTVLLSIIERTVDVCHDYLALHQPSSRTTSDGPKEKRVSPPEINSEGKTHRSSDRSLISEEKTKPPLAMDLPKEIRGEVTTTTLESGVPLLGYSLKEKKIRLDQEEEDRALLERKLMDEGAEEQARERKKLDDYREAAIKREAATAELLGISVLQLKDDLYHSPHYTRALIRKREKERKEKGRKEKEMKEKKRKEEIKQNLRKERLDSHSQEVKRERKLEREIEEYKKKIYYKEKEIKEKEEI